MGTHVRTAKPAFPMTASVSVRHQVPTAVVARTGSRSQSAIAPANLSVQLKRANQFGHHFSNVQVDAVQRFTAPVQGSVIPRLGYLQRQLVDEEQKRDEDAESMQRKAVDRETERTRAQSPQIQEPEGRASQNPTPMQTSHQPVQFFFLSMLIGALLKPVLDMLFGGAGGGGGGGGGATGGGGGGGGGESDY